MNLAMCYNSRASTLAPLLDSISPEQTIGFGRKAKPLKSQRLNMPKSITVELSPSLYERLQQAADAMKQSIEDVVEQSIRGNLPPALTDAPPALQQEIELLQRADRATLWRIAHEQLPHDQWQRHKELLERNQAGALSPDEQAELHSLRERTDLFVLRRAYALALLKWRGQAAPVSPEIAA